MTARSVLRSVIMRSINMFMLNYVAIDLLQTFVILVANIVHDIRM